MKVKSFDELKGLPVGSEVFVVYPQTEESHANENIDNYRVSICRGEIVSSNDHVVTIASAGDSFSYNDAMFKPWTEGIKRARVFCSEEGEDIREEVMDEFHYVYCSLNGYGTLDR